ncbi:uncharacterized protein DUF4865 [Nitrospirillum amazonense]|uniref:Uncharacterized protein DUF4865 n=1 Tax=Nitrospirillum amazonense TaxID=28077 RepID=A0A560JK20_9PROT|nr:DUF4865 family protein [Nitrospirillum amazonense]TWB69754.1 uncharacterized protein DUF4865 [Nitrospirillum amazonense]
MLIAHYSHRLTADYDLDILRKRAETNAARWAAMPELYFKGFLLREAGRHGAIANAYSSLYLWRQDAAFRDFLVHNHYKAVTDTFGRADIDVRVALDARKGRARDARYAVVDNAPISMDTALGGLWADEIALNREVAEGEDIVASAVGVDTRTWTLTRVRLAAEAPSNPPATAVTYQVLQLARPLLETLPSSRQE